MWTEVAKVGDIAVGGLKFVKLGGAQATLANCDGTFYAVGRRCGHMNAPLDQGSLSGHVLTCPLHFGQFDVRDGAVLAYPLDRHFGAEPLPAARPARARRRAAPAAQDPRRRPRHLAGARDRREHRGRRLESPAPTASPPSRARVAPRQGVRRSKRQGGSHGLRTAASALGRGRTRAGHVGAHDQLSLRQAPPGLRRQPEQARGRHRPRRPRPRRGHRARPPATRPRRGSSTTRRRSGTTPSSGSR